MASINRDLARFFYDNQTETGREKLIVIKADLYEATTKALHCAIEMYSQKRIDDWIKDDLGKFLENNENKVFDKLIELYRDKSGSRDMMDITNSCLCINNMFFAGDFLNKSKEKVTSMQESLNKRMDELKELKNVALASVNPEEEEFIETDEIQDGDESYEFEHEHTDYDINNKEAVSEDDNADDDDDDEDNIDDSYGIASENYGQESSVLTGSETSVGELEEEIKKLEVQHDNLKKLLGKSGLLQQQKEKETYAVDSLRIMRNINYAHYTGGNKLTSNASSPPANEKTEEDELKSIDEKTCDEIIEEWVPEAGPLYLWGMDIMRFIDVIFERYDLYVTFDSFYLKEEFKSNFAKIRVEVQKHIDGLYVNHSNVFLEFSGNTYYPNGEDGRDFNAFMVSMAKNWKTGIKYLTVVTNEDMPELNVFFKECLAGTNKYVNVYLENRNALRRSYNEKSGAKNYDYFRLLYNLSPQMDTLYWKGRAYSCEEFKNFIYKIASAPGIVSLIKLFCGYKKEFIGIDLITWSRHHFLSNYMQLIFKTEDNPSEKKKQMMLMENAISDFSKSWGFSEIKNRLNAKEKITNAKNSLKPEVYEDLRRRYTKVIQTASDFYFGFAENAVYVNKICNEDIEWKSLEDAREYIRKYIMENEKMIAYSSYVNNLFNKIDLINKSDYFDKWCKYMAEKEEKTASFML